MVYIINLSSAPPLHALEYYDRIENTGTKKTPAGAGKELAGGRQSCTEKAPAPKKLDGISPVKRGNLLKTAGAYLLTF